MVPALCDQVVAKLVVEPDTGKRNLEISLDIVREKCTGRFYIVGPEELTLGLLIFFTILSNGTAHVLRASSKFL